MREDRGWQAIEAAQAPPAGAPASRRWLIALTGFWIGACLWLIAGRWTAIRALALPDTDDNMRLLQVRDWLGGQGWYDLRQYRLAPPMGADIHWSRLVDLPLAALIAPLTPLIGRDGAEAVAAVAVPLLTLLVAMGLAAAIARRAIAPDAWPWAPAMLLMATPAMGMLAPLRIDHHGWQIAALYATVLGLIARDRRDGGIVAGLGVAASLAIGVEMLPYLGLAGMLAAIGWVADPGERTHLRAFAASAGIGTLAALFLFVPPAIRFAGGCDALSSAWAAPLCLGAAAIFGATFVPVNGWRGRGILVLAAGIIAALPLVGAGGVCLTDPYHAVDPAARRLWLDIVTEALPLFRQPMETALASLVLPLIGLAGAAVMLWRRQGEPRAWALIAAISAFGILLSLLQTRAGVTAQAMAAPGAAALGWLGRGRLARSGSMLARVLGSVLLFLCVAGLAPRIAIALLFAEPPTPAEAARDATVAACAAPAAMARLDALPPGTFLGFIDTTPALILHTHHTGLAGPYHRNGRAIADVMTAFAGDDATARAIAGRYRAGYVFLCGDPSEARVYARRNPMGLAARLMHGKAPAWLAPVPLAGTPWRVWRIGA